MYSMNRTSAPRARPNSSKSTSSSSLSPRDDDGVDLRAREAGARAASMPASTAGSASNRVSALKRSRSQRVEADGQPVQAGRAQRRGVRPRAARRWSSAPGRACQGWRPAASIRSGRSRRSSGSPPVSRTRSTPSSREHVGQPRDLLEREHVLARQPEVLVLRHAVVAAEVAPVRDRQRAGCAAAGRGVDESPCGIHYARRSPRIIGASAAPEETDAMSQLGSACLRSTPCFGAAPLAQGPPRPRRPRRRRRSTCRRTRAHHARSRPRPSPTSTRCRRSRSRWSIRSSATASSASRSSRRTQLPVDILEQERLQGREGRRRHPDGVHGDVGQRQAGHRARLRHRRHPAGLAEAGRRVSRSAHRGRAGPRRRPQLRQAAEHHRGASCSRRSCSARRSPARSGSGRASPKSCSARRRTTCAPGCSKTSTSRCSPTSAPTSASRGATAAAPGWCPSQYSFKGECAHAAGAPWRGRSALDAVELMDVGWNFRREHLPLSQRSHYVITDGGDQPNVVPPTASVWYYFRQTTYPSIKDLWADRRQDGQGRGDDDRHELLPTRVLGSAWPRHFNRASRRRCTRTSRRSGCRHGATPIRRSPRRCRRSSASREDGLSTRVGNAAGPVPEAQNTGGGSDDIGDISWNVPTVTLRYPSNIPGLPGHNWANGDRDGDADRAQGRHGRRQGAGDDDDRSVLKPEWSRRRGTTSRTCRRRIRNTSRSSARRISRPSS